MDSSKMHSDNFFMREAIVQAKLAKNLCEVAVGAVIVHENKIIAAAHNMRHTTKDPTAHAELLAIRSAAQNIGDWRLTGCTLYVTLEPCPMCAGAIVASRISRVVYGAYDAAAGCVSSVYRICDDAAFGGNIQTLGGVLAAECAQVLNDGFIKIRNQSQQEDCK